MLISRVILKNWRNFLEADVSLQKRNFIIGPNGSGKSNFLDIFRFLRDISSPDGGGMQKAVQDRGGMSKLRCLAAQKATQVEIEVHLANGNDKHPLWKYSIGITQEKCGQHQVLLHHEKVWKNDTLILDRPDSKDQKDKERLTQTHLEQINANAEFRDIANFLSQSRYLHLIPQMLRHPETFHGRIIARDPYGQGFLELIAGMPEKTRNSRLKKIFQALQIAVPQLKQLRFQHDPVSGKPHLETQQKHWRPKAGWQREEQFSDGTLRIIGFLWAILEGNPVLLLEEPELSLNSSIVRQLPSIIHRIQQKKKQQILISTHSPDLLMDKGIDGRETLLLTPEKEGTKIFVAADIKEIRPLLETGMSIAEAVLPRTRTDNTLQLGLF